MMVFFWLFWQKWPQTPTHNSEIFQPSKATVLFSWSVFRKEGCHSLWQNTNQVCTSIEKKKKKKLYLLLLSISRLGDQPATAAAAPHSHTKDEFFFKYWARPWLTQVVIKICQSLSLSIFLTLCLCLSLFLSHPLSLSLSLFLSHPLCLSLSFSPSPCLSLILTLNPFLSLSLNLSILFKS